MTKRLTPEREQEIRECPDYDDEPRTELLLEIDTLREENKEGRALLFKRLAEVTRERDQLRAEAGSLFHSLTETDIKLGQVTQERDLARVQLGDIHLDHSKLMAENERLKSLLEGETDWHAEYQKLKEKNAQLDELLVARNSLITAQKEVIIKLREKVATLEQIDAATECSLLNAENKTLREVLPEAAKVKDYVGNLEMENQKLRERIEAARQIAGKHSCPSCGLDDEETGYVNGFNACRELFIKALKDDDGK